MKMVIKNETVRFGFNHCRNFAEKLNEAYAQGYRFACDGDYKECGIMDPWSGMPEITQNVYLFDTREEAEAFAINQKWPFSGISAEVFELPPHVTSWKELLEAEEKKEAEKKARKAAKEAAKAAAAGLSVEEYTERKKKAAKARRYENEAASMEAEILRLKKEIAWRKQKAAEIKAEIGE